MGIAFLVIGTGGALVPLFSAGLEKEFGWHLALGALGILIVLIALPMAYFIKEPKLKVEGKKDWSLFFNKLHYFDKII